MEQNQSKTFLSSNPPSARRSEMTQNSQKSKEKLFTDLLRTMDHSQGFEKFAGRWLESRPLIFFQQRAGWSFSLPARVGWTNFARATEQVRAPYEPFLVRSVFLSQTK